jgi:hypothetical protein
MVVVLAFAGIVGAGTTAVGLWSFGWLVAVLCAPLGGSLFALITALFLALRRLNTSSDLPLVSDDGRRVQVAFWPNGLFFQ